MTVKAKIQELKAGIAALDAILLGNIKCLYCGEHGPWREDGWKAGCGCVGVACARTECVTLYNYRKSGCDTCRLKRLTSCLMCGQDYGGYNEDPAHYRTLKAKCGCTGYGCDCANYRVSPGLIFDGPACNIDASQNDCHKCRTK